MNWLSITAITMSLLVNLSAYAQSDDLFQSCLLEALAGAGSGTTVGDLRRACEEKIGKEKLNARTMVMTSSDAAASNRLREEAATEEQAFVITPYLPNYVLFGAYNFSGNNSTFFQEATGDSRYELDDVELKFQLSLKVPLGKDLLGNNGDMYAAYTNRSFWQAYNTAHSSPFRETNHQPEAWLRLYNRWEFWGIRNIVNDFGIVHQSNGRGGILSRSWNRIYARFVFEKNDLAFAFQPWYRIKEDEEKDNNPDIEDYMGNFEFTAAYK
ncbi:MAG: phospholipase A, partial [Gammaproteobacteria bacterium]|nr:phospholipase A [Gammaproteobacteria bacterium]